MPLDKRRRLVYYLAMTKNVTKQKIVETGMSLMLQKGYNHTGILEVLQRVDLPKGSFYHYFSSKEEFGMAVLEHFVNLHNVMIERYLTDQSLTPLNRMRRYF